MTCSAARCVPSWAAQKQCVLAASKRRWRGTKWRRVGRIARLLIRLAGCWLRTMGEPNYVGSRVFWKLYLYICDLHGTARTFDASD
jgi:hypothetical protein